MKTSSIARRGGQPSDRTGLGLGDLVTTGAQVGESGRTDVALNHQAGRIGRSRIERCGEVAGVERRCLDRIL